MKIFYSEKCPTLTIPKAKRILCKDGDIRFTHSILFSPSDCNFYFNKWDMKHYNLINFG